jgi:hypothetical protein
VPSKKLKAMQWKKAFSKDIPDSVWDKLDIKEFVGKVDFGRIDSLFEANKEEEAKPLMAMAEGSKIVQSILTNDNKLAICNLVTPVSLTNVAILMGKDPIDEHLIANALHEMNDKVFTPRLALQMKKCFYDKQDNEMFIPEYVKCERFANL